MGLSAQGLKEQLLDQVAKMKRHPIYTGAGVVGGIVADQLLGKPVEGLVDAVTLNALNLRPDERYGTTMTAMPQQPMPTPYNNPVFSSQPNDLPFAQGQIPPLSAEEITREIERQQKNMGVSAVTVNGLRQMQLAQQNNPYAQS